jgi:hypothetical protein
MSSFFSEILSANGCFGGKLLSSFECWVMDKMGVSSISRQKRLSSDLCVGSIFRRKELMTGLTMTMFLAVSNGFQ